MKEIRSFDKSYKYSDSEYEKVEEGICRYKGRYVSSLAFQQEPELGEGTCAAQISQYPLEDILDRYSVYVSDFYRDLNTADSTTCVLEFTGFTLADIQKLREIIGKHVYTKPYQADGQTYAELIIE